MIHREMLIDGHFIGGECDQAVGRHSAKRAVLWQPNGTPTEIPNLGGEAWHTPMAINAQGDVVGFGNPPGVTGGAFAPWGFFWSTSTGIRPLEPLTGDATAQARGLNSARQAVGTSAGPNGSSAVLWQDFVAYDLNQYVLPGFPDRLLSAQDITDDGVITGALLEASTGRTLAYAAYPLKKK